MVSIIFKTYSNFRLQYFSYNWHSTFPLFLYELKSNDFTDNGAYVLTTYIIAFDFIILSNLNPSHNNFIKILFIRLNCILFIKFYFFGQLTKQLFDVFKYFINNFKNIKVFFGMINSNKLPTKLLFYCFFISYSIFLSLWPFSLISIASL